MKNLTRIYSIIYETPWLILPGVHKNIQKQLEQYLQGNIQLPNIEVDENEEVEDNTDKEESPGKIALIEIDGIIGKHLGLLETACGGVDVDIISAQLDEVASHPEVEHVILYINTPGGTVVGVPELADKINEVSKIKNVIAYVDVQCTSAGYYLASQANTIYAAPSADIGSVGVYAVYLDESLALAKEGLKVNAISAGKYKLTGASWKEMSKEEKEMLQKDVDRIYKEFKEAIWRKRDIKEEDLQGQIYSGPDVVNKNFVDGNINSLTELIDFLENNNK